MLTEIVPREVSLPLQRAAHVMASSTVSQYDGQVDVVGADPPRREAYTEEKSRETKASPGEIIVFIFHVCVTCS